MSDNHIKKFPNGYVWFLVHRKELMDQTISTFKRFNLDLTQVYIGMIQTLASQIKRNKLSIHSPSMIIIDEAHHATSNTYKTIIDKYPNVPLIGLTATPIRMDNKPLGNIFNSLVMGVSSDYLISNGYLSTYDYYAPKIGSVLPDIKGNDYDVDKIIYDHKIYGKIERYIDYNRKTIIYCPSIKFSKSLCDRIGAVHFDGDTPKDERDRIVQDFRDGKIKIISNVDLIGEGFDCPDCDCVMLLRPTMSLGLYIQQSMRCLRPAPNKKAIIYDFVGNVFRHGMPTEERTWTLDKKIECNIKNPSGEQDIIVRECKNCFRVYKGINRICPYCGYDNGKTKKQIKEEQDAELEKIARFEKINKRREVGMAKTRQALEEIARKRGYNEKWVYVQCKIKGISHRG